MSEITERDRFEAWFASHAGAKPDARLEIEDLEAEVSFAADALGDAESRLEARWRWEAQRSAALAAWSEATFDANRRK